MYRFNLLSTSLLLSLGACEGRGEDSGTEADADTDADSDTDTDADAGYSVSGTAIDFAARTPAADGLSVSFADPQPALTGGELAILATATTAGGGLFTVSGIEAKPALGAFLVVTGGDNMPTATGVATTAYADLADGDAITDVSAYVISNVLAGGVNDSAAPLGYTGDVLVDGLLMVLVRDNTGNPAIGATVTNSQGSMVYYLDGDPTDGLFTTMGAPNTATDSSGIAVIPGGAIDTYEATSGAQYGSQLGGTLPGLAAFIGINLADM